MNVNVIIFLFILSFALVNPIWNINGVRMWTAAQIYLYGALLYFVEGNRKGVFWILASVLFHFSFIFPIVIFLVYLVVPKNDVVLFVFFISTIFIVEFDIDIIDKIINYLPELFRLKLFPYLNPDYAIIVLEEKSSSSLHVVIANALSNWYLYIWATVIFFTRKKCFENFSTGNKLFNFALFLGGWSQIISFLPSGGRFLVISTACFYFVFVIVLTKIEQDSLHIKIAHWTVPLIIFLVLFNIRIGFDYIGILHLLGNPLIALFVEQQSPLIDYIKFIF